MSDSNNRPHVLFVGEKKSFFAREILRGIFSMRSEGCDWNFWCVPESISIDELSDCLASKHVEGIIARGLAPELARHISALDVPSVLIRDKEDASAEYINGPHADDQAIGKLAGDEFSHLRLGYWGFVHWEGVMWSEARKKTFHSYATSLAVSNDTLSLSPEVRGNWAGILKIAEWVEKLPKPCGVLACKDEVGLDVLHACEMLGLSVPDDVAVIAVDNDRLLCESSSPSLTSIDLMADSVGRVAVVQLAKLLGYLEESYSIGQCRSVLVARESSHRKDQYSLVYQKALDIMSAKPLIGMGVEELARACGVSRRGLERAFKKCALKSPASLIREKKVEAIAKQLRNNSVSIESISYQAGFSDTAGFSNFVKRMTGKTPSELRSS